MISSVLRLESLKAENQVSIHVGFVGIMGFPNREKKKIIIIFDKELLLSIVGKD